MLEPGVVIDGRYEVEALVGEGGLAQVYRVRHQALGSVHALKLLSWRKKQLADRLLTEGRIQAQLTHPNIVSVIDLVHHDGQFGLLMEYVDNQNLEDLIVESQGLGVERGLTLFAPILSAVVAAHDAGVTHRDLKPANILLAKGPGGIVPKVTDFGIAKVMAELSQSSTAAGSTMGTPGYLAPEQIEDSSTIDRRADVFALGAIIYELITGAMAFIEPDGSVGVMSTSRVQPKPLATWTRDPVSPDLEAAIFKAIAKEPADRWPDCRAFARALYSQRPQLLSIVEDAGGSTVNLSLSGSTEAVEPLPRERTEETLDEGIVEAVGPVAAPVAAPVASPAAASGSRLGLGLALLGAGVALVLVGVVGGSMMSGDQGATTAPPKAVQTEAEPTLPVASAVPEPPSPEAQDAIEPVPAVEAPAPSPVAEPDPAPAPSPSPDPQPVGGAEPAPEPDVQPAPSPEPNADAERLAAAIRARTATVKDDTDDGVAVVAPAPAEPVAQPVVIEKVEPAPDPAPEPVALPQVGGAWKGRANKRPFRLQLEQAGGGLSGSVVFPGATVREEAVSGSVDASGRIRFTAGDLTFTGTVSGAALSGVYTGAGSKQLPWSAQR